MIVVLSLWGSFNTLRSGKLRNSQVVKQNVALPGLCRVNYDL